MSWDDDKDAPASFSSHKRFTRADKGKKDALKKKIKEKVGMEKESDKQKVDLKSQMNLQSLKNEFAGKKDQETKRKKEVEEKAKERSTAPKTKSIKEREESLLENAHERIDADTLIQREEAQADLSDEETTPEPG
jgi:hypothetical protein